jgi:formylglycine-generating enzyme required for sulfatase activity
VRITAGGASYCVDRTEVTNAQYARFVAARNNALGLMDQDPHCAWNGSYVPTSWPYPAGREGYPVANVDWCDAYAFCKWAGKRLCGRIGGGRVARSDGIDATRSQWYAACSASGARVYPYGNTYVAASCNGEDVSGNALRPAGSSPACAGGASPELLDLSGNVWEWEDSCSAYTMAGGAIERCKTRGGGYQSPATNLRCVSRGDRNRDDGNGDTGFRCCGP